MDKKPLSCPVPLLLIVNSAFSSRTSALLFLILLSFFSAHCRQCCRRCNILRSACDFPSLSSAKKGGNRRRENCISRPALSFFFTALSLSRARASLCRSVCAYASNQIEPTVPTTTTTITKKDGKKIANEEKKRRKKKKKKDDRISSKGNDCRL